MKRVATIVALVIGLALSSCGGSDDDAARPAPTATPSESGLPPEFLQCMADNGYDVEQGADIHSAPQELLQECFGALHGDAEMFPSLRTRCETIPTRRS
jgi:hypothetical protein